MEEFTGIWQAIARRYADIPNEYLSFTLFVGECNITNDILLPSVEAIRQESPERCIIADIFSSRMNAREFAELGVALSCRIQDVNENAPIFKLNKYYGYNQGKVYMNAQGLSLVENLAPEDVDAEKLLTAGRSQEIMEIAQESGVGFMISGFGVEVPYNPYSAWNGGQKNPRVRYSDETLYAMITGITDVVESNGYGWCYGQWYSPYGVAFGAPVIRNTAYIQIEDYPYYIDQTMLHWFQQINGVA